MAIAYSVPDNTAASALPGAGLLVLLRAMPPEQVEIVLANLATSFSMEGLTVDAPEALKADSSTSLRVVAVPATNASWTLSSADFINASQLANQCEARAVLMLGPESSSLSSSALSELANAVLASPTDLAVPRFDLPPHTGLVTSAIVYPLTRALFASRVRFPVAVDLGLSLRMAKRLAGAAQRLAAANQGEAPLWVVNEAAVAGFNVDQFDVGPRIQPQPAVGDLKTILPQIIGSLFSDIDAKAAFWQRSRRLPPALDTKPTIVPRMSSTDAAAEIASMVQTFRLAVTDLREIWSLFLPPNTLLGIKRLSEAEAEAFRMPDNLWARIVFDFLLAYRLRTINRGHLLGAMIPLYLAWVASHLNIVATDTDPESHIEMTAAAFEVEKTYLVSRWRWPDRFNP